MRMGILQRQLRRGWIINILNYSNGETNDKLIQAALSDAGHEVTMPTLHSDLEYLAAKGYVETRGPEGIETPFAMKVAKLTVKGIDLLEGSITDVGIGFSHN